MEFEDHTLRDLLQSLEGEVAKTLNEIRHAEEDLSKAQTRQKFTLALIHHLKNRFGDIL